MSSPLRFPTPTFPSHFACLIHLINLIKLTSSLAPAVLALAIDKQEPSKV